jgi:antitoxin component YwqK of YwqJK toxin-antitoxin module
MAQAIHPSAVVSVVPDARSGAGSEGPSEQMDSDGLLTHRATLHDGKLDGDFYAFGVDGVTRVKAGYVGGELDGVMTLRDDAGRLQQEATYRCGLLEGITRAYLGGRLLNEQTYKEGRLHGPSIAYSAAGQVCMRQFFVNGQLEGEAVYLHEGRVVRKVNYRSGLQHGEATEFSRDEEPVQKAQYKNDLLDGTTTRFWPNGSPLETQDYKIGMPVGVMRRFDQSGDEISDELTKPSLMQRLEQMVKG